MSYPLSFSKEFRGTIILDIIGQAVQSPSRLPFAISGILSQAIASMKPFPAPLLLPSKLVYKLANCHSTQIRLVQDAALARQAAQASQAQAKKLAWIAPALGISAVTLLGRVAYDFMPNSLLKGLIYGVHTAAIGMLTNVVRCDWPQTITLRSVFDIHLNIPHVFENLSKNGQKVTWERSELLASAAFITTSFALSFFGGFHVITANVAAHVTAAAIKSISPYFLATIAQKIKTD